MPPPLVGRRCRLPPLPRLVRSSLVRRAYGRCWVFLGYKNPHGYGMVGCKGRVWLTHRLAYTELVGPIPVGLELDHLCRNRACYNPAHLEPVSHLENVRRGVSGETSRRRQQAKTHCPRGHPYSHPNLYLSADGKHRMCRACRQERDRSRYARAR